MTSTVVYRGYGESLEGVNPSRIHRIRSIVVYEGCGESLDSAHLSSIHYMRFAPGGGGGNGPYADSVPLSSQFQGGGGGVWGRLKGRGPPGPQHIWLKMTPSLR